MDDLVFEHLLDITKNPLHKGKNSGVEIHEYNPTCGDNLFLYILVENNIIVDAKFDGYSCALTTASAEIFCNFIVGKKINTVKKIIMPEYHELLGFKVSPFRANCQNLPYMTFQKYFLKHDIIQK